MDDGSTAGSKPLYCMRRIYRRRKAQSDYRVYIIGVEVIDEGILEGLHKSIWKRIWDCKVGKCIDGLFLLLRRKQQ